MLKTLGIVEVRPRESGAFRTQTLGDVAARKLGAQSLLEWIVRRATESQRLTGVVVLTPGGPETPRISAIVPSDIPVVIRSDADQLSRFAGVLESYSVDAVVRIRDDSPFLDPVLIDRLISTADAHPNCDYISYCSRAAQPSILSSVGVFAEWFRVGAIRRADRRATAPADRADVTRYVVSHPEEFNLRLIPAPVELDRNDVRLQVNFDEDWENAQTIFDALGPEGLEWQRIAGFLDQQPRLREQMAALNRR